MNDFINFKFDKRSGAWIWGDLDNGIGYYSTLRGNFQANIVINGVVHTITGNHIEELEKECIRLFKELSNENSR